MIQPKLLTYDLHKDVEAFSTTRFGGFSTGAYGEFNINRYCGDDVEAICKNRALLCQQLGISDDRLIMPHQVHLAQSVQIDEAFFALSEEDRQTRLEGIDAVMTHLTDICIGVSTADCIPLLVYDPRQHAVAAIHAGWRGTVQRIAQQTIADMTAAYGSQPADLRVRAFRLVQASVSIASRWATRSMTPLPARDSRWNKSAKDTRQMTVKANSSLFTLHSSLPSGTSTCLSAIVSNSLLPTFPRPTSPLPTSAPSSNRTLSSPPVDWAFSQAASSRVLSVNNEKLIIN